LLLLLMLLLLLLSFLRLVLVVIFAVDCGYVNFGIFSRLSSVH